MPNKLEEAGISWVILGSQTKPYRPPSIEAVQEIVEACDKAGVAVFLKDNLKPIIPRFNLPFYAEVDGKDGFGLPLKVLAYRQELPNV